MSIHLCNGIKCRQLILFTFIFTLISIIFSPELPLVGRDFSSLNHSEVRSSTGRFITAERGEVIELPGLNFDGEDEIYTGEKLIIKGDIILTNNSDLTLRDCEVLIEAPDPYGISIEIDRSSSLVMENTTLNANGTVKGYNITCLGRLSLYWSKLEGFASFIMSNATGSMDSSNISIGEEMLLQNNSHLTLLNSTIDHEEIEIEGSSILYFQEYLHITVTSWYLGPVEVATVSIESMEGSLLSTDMTDKKGTIPVVTMETARRYSNRTIYNGPNIINVSHSKYHGNKTTANVSNNQVITIYLEPILGYITGWVSLPDGSAVPDAAVSNEVVQSMTSEDGNYLLSVFARTTCTLIAMKEHYSKEYYPGAYVGEEKTIVVNFTIREDAPPFNVKFLESSVYKIPVNKTLVVEFPVELDPNTVNISTVRLYRSDGNSNIAVNRMIAPGEDMRSVRITTLEDMKEFSWHDLILKKEIRALDNGEVIWRDFSYRFKTDYEPVQTTVPVDGAREVIVSEPITIEFKVPISRDTLNASTVFVLDSNGNLISRELLMTGENIIILKRKANLAYDSSYTVVITPLLRDSDGQSVFIDGYSFSFRTAAQVFLPIIHLNVTGEGGVPLEFSAAPRINITRDGFFLDIPADGPVVRRDLSSGFYNITAYAKGYVNSTVFLILDNDNNYNHTFELINMEISTTGERTSVGTIIVIGVIMGMFLLTILFLGVRRADNVVRGNTKKNIQRSGAPGMESFEYKLAPELSVSELPSSEKTGKEKRFEGEGRRKSSR